MSAGLKEYQGTQKKDLQFHQAANIFPLLDDDPLQQLVDDIRQHGLRQPIVLFDGKILDGRNRYRACLLAQVEPVFQEFDGNRREALAYVWSTNAARRHLTPGQAAIACANREKLDAEYAAELETMRESLNKGGRPSKNKKPPQTFEEVSDRNDREINHKIAEAAGTNRTYVATARKVVEQRPDLADKVMAGELTLPQANAEIKREEKRKELDRAAAEAQKQHREDMPKWTLMNVDVVDGLTSVREEWGPVQLIFADPPYNIGIDYGDGEEADSLNDYQYMHWVDRWLRECVDCLADNGTMWVMIGDEYAGEYAVKLKQLGLTIRNWVKWYESFGVNCSNKFNRCSRHLFYCVADPNRFTFNPDVVTRESDRQAKYNDKRASGNGKIWDDVWTIPRLTGTCDERIPDVPTQIPLALVQAIVECCSMPGDLVVDPFTGSGTTGVASVITGRRFVGVEKSEKYADIAHKRIMGAKP